MSYAWKRREVDLDNYGMELVYERCYPGGRLRIRREEKGWSLYLGSEAVIAALMQETFLGWHGTLSSARDAGNYILKVLNKKGD